jgi:hypothetical protein
MMMQMITTACCWCRLMGHPGKQMIRLAILLAFCASPLLAQDDVQPPPCVVVPTGAVLQSGVIGEGTTAWRYQFYFDVPNMSDAFDDILSRLAKDGHMMGEDVSAMGDGSLIIYPCGDDLLASVSTQGALAEPGLLIVTLGIPGG